MKPRCMACSLDGMSREATECREVEGLIMHLCRGHALELDTDRLEENEKSTPSALAQC